MKQDKSEQTDKLMDSLKNLQLLFLLLLSTITKRHRCCIDDVYFIRQVPTLKFKLCLLGEILAKLGQYLNSMYQALG